MKKLLLLFALLFLAASASAQLGVRVDRSIIRPENNVSRFLIYDTGTINICASPANGVPCTNKVTTYTDDTLGTPCSTATQVVWAETNTCVSGTDSFGDWGVWVPGGQYTYTITYPDGSSEGPFPFTAGSGSTGAAAHNLLSTVHPDTTPATVQRGDLVIGQGVSPKWARKAIGANGTALCSDGTDANWGTCFNNSLIEQIVPPRTDLSYAILYPTSFAQYGGPTAFGSTSAGVSSGFLQRFKSTPLGDWDVWITWSNYVLPSYVTAANVQYVYAVVVQGGTAINLISGCSSSVSFNATINCSGSGAITSPGAGGQTNILLASGGAATTFSYSTATIAVDSAETISETLTRTSNIAAVALVVFYSGTQVPQSSAIQVVPPLFYNQELNTLSFGTESAPPPSGTVGLPTLAINSGACSATQTSSAVGVKTLDLINWTFAADPSGVTGYGASASGHLDIYAWPTADNINFKVCNSTGGSITPGAMTLNWKVNPQ